MNSAWREAARELFLAAIALPPGERAAFLSRATEDARLRAHVAESLRDHDAAGGFLTAPTLNLGSTEESEACGRAPAATPAELAHGPGRRLGNYILCERIGQGGFSDVYRAIQREPLRREVAVKVIRPEVANRQAWARLERERQAMAEMEHPNIARVFDAGATAEGRPYFVLELLRGEPITEYCSRVALALEARLRLFREVCAAVSHAHGLGVVHRDLKPSNILVCEVGGQATVKVIDFGIAKFAGYSNLRDTAITEAGSFLGTPGYVSPEQLRGGANATGVRSDIYTLGILLYELLTGTHPGKGERQAVGYGWHSASTEPPPPSARLLQLARREGRRERRRQVRQDARCLGRDLDWVTMRAMAIDPERRYGSVMELHDDLWRRSRGEPVSARPEQFAWRLRRPARFGSAISAGVALGTVAALVIGAVILAWTRANGAAMPPAVAARSDARDHAATVALAAHACEVGDLARAAALLARVPADLRGWEWHHLRRCTDPAELTSEALDANPRAIAVSPDERFAAAITGDRSLTVTTAETGATAGRLQVRSVIPVAVACSPHSDSIVVAGPRSRSDPVHGLELHRWPSDAPAWTATGSVSDAPFSPDGKTIVACAGRHLVFLDVASGATTRAITLEHQRLARAVFADAPDRVWALLLDTENRATGLLILDGEVARVRTLPRQLAAARIDPRHRTLVGFAPEGVAIGLALPDLTLSWQVATPSVRRPLHCGISPDGQLAIAVHERGVSVRDLLTAAQVDIATPDGSMTCCALGTASQRLYYGSSDRRVRALRCSSAGARTSIAPLDRWRQMNASFNADASLVLTMGWGSARLWDCRTDALRWARTLGKADLLTAAFAPDDARIAVTDRAGNVSVLDTATGAVLDTHPFAPAQVVDVGWSEHLGEVVIATQGDLRFLRPRDDGSRGLARTGTEPVGRLALSRAGDRLLILPAGSTGRMECRDLTTARQLWRTGAVGAGATDTPTAAAFAPTVRRVAIGFSGGRIEWRDADSGALQAEALVADGRIAAVACSPDGARVAVATQTTLYLVDPDSLAAPVVLAHGLHGTLAVAFSAGDDALIVATADSILRLETSSPPPDVQQRRWLARRVRALVDPLWGQLRLAEDVAADLKAKPSLPSELEDAALEHIAARGDFVNGIRSDALWYARRRDARAETHAAALAALVGLERRAPPCAGTAELTRALLEHRLQLHGQARERVLAHDRARPPKQPRERAMAAAILALIEQGRGEPAAASIARQRMEAAVRDAKGRLDDTSSVLVAEVRMLVDDTPGPTK